MLTLEETWYADLQYHFGAVVRHALDDAGLEDARERIALAVFNFGRNVMERTTECGTTDVHAALSDAHTAAIAKRTVG